MQRNFLTISNLQPMSWAGILDRPANRVLEKCTKLGKSDRDLMTQFIRGLPTPNRIHTITQDTDTFNGATRIATLFETTQTFGQDDSTTTRDKCERTEL